MTPRDHRRFWAKVRKTDGCWEWTGYRAIIHGGLWHGRFRLNGKIRKAHRVSWEIEHGAVQDDLCVCHHCDNPGCVRPSHLFVSTPAGNQMDKLRKGRQRVAHGIEYKRTKLDPEKVAEIKRAVAEGATQLSQAARFGVSATAVHDIFRGQSWAWIDGATSTRRSRRGA